ncbi:hypothetical protein PHLGIDRAFT_308473 [Phlebiopsis gigantea 11061_1 CR5-6]|uniref:Uncharacterized protein n=1 Tax=Phlebiopsis gigantea (strain 11061_1 CR5-6) TaxID=745531 RepID=A0A0C3SDI9_PHLG1|nr:hypothetical protein PHLGIDRAFT_308473 [Phlebiopsis gigantea 11061_1 CR5-6]
MARRPPPPQAAPAAYYYHPFQIMAPKSDAGRSPKTVSPIHALPVELLSRVFMLGQPDNTPYPDFPPDCSPTFEVLVSHVCHHWREIALATPSLWTTIHLRLKSHMDRSRAYLYRRKHKLIDILVDTCAEDEYEPGYNLFRPEFIDIFEPFKPTVDAWRSFALKVRHKDCKIGARDVLSTCGSARNLEYLQLWHIENWESAERLFTQIGPPPVVIFDKELPKLQHLSLIGVNVPWAQVNFLEDLTTIEFALHSVDVRIPYEIWANMLKTSPRLEKLSLYYSGPKPGDFPWPNEVIALPGMKELSLTDLDAPYLCDILRYLHMPHLTTLRLELPAQEPGQSFAELIDDLIVPKRPEPTTPATTGAQKQPAQPAGTMFPQLATLAVHALECTPADFRRLLEAAPTVTRLDVGCARLDAALVDELLRVSAPAEVDAADKGKGRAPYAGVLLPDLDTVRVSGLAPATLLRLVDFRRAQGRPVHTWLVSERMRDAALERAAAEMDARGDGERIEWFKSDEDEEDDGDDDEEGDDEDAEGYTDDEEDDVAGPPKIASADAPFEDDNVPVEYSDEEEE